MAAGSSGGLFLSAAFPLGQIRQADRKTKATDFGLVICGLGS
jgi:hypothetical protein